MENSEIEIKLNGKISVGTLTLTYRDIAKREMKNKQIKQDSTLRLCLVHGWEFWKGNQQSLPVAKILHFSVQTAHAALQLVHVSLQLVFLPLELSA